MGALPGPRTVRVGPTRIEAWLRGLAERHGQPRIEVTADALVLCAPDGAVARIGLAWGPPAGAPAPAGRWLWLTSAAAAPN